VSIDTGGPAFPVTPTDRSGQIAATEPGMTLRDWFAGRYQVHRDSEGNMLGYSIPQLMSAFAIAQPNAGDILGWLKLEIDIETRLKLIHADAMLKAREAKS